MYALKARLLALLGGVVLLPLAACGGGGGDVALPDLSQAPPGQTGQPDQNGQNGNDNGQNGGTTPPNTGGGTTTPQPAPQTLDQELQDLLTQGGVTALNPDQPEPRELVDLGRELFRDNILSGNRNISCETCHTPRAATADALPTSIGEGGVGLAEMRRTTNSDQLIPRNAPAVFNLGLSQVTTMFWDSRVSYDAATDSFTTPSAVLNGSNPQRPDLVEPLEGSVLAVQAMFPVLSHAEMRGDPGENEIADAATDVEAWDRLMARLVGTNDGRSGGVAAYRTLFSTAFPQVQNFDDFNFGHAARAIAAFQKQRWTALDTPFDNYVRGNLAALDDQEKRGAILFFGNAGCNFCHSGSLLSDFDHHALGIPQIGPGTANGDDIGRSAITGDPANDYEFRTPMLRNVALTSPYMHDGAYATLEEVIQHYLRPEQSLRSFTGNRLPVEWRNTVNSDPAQMGARVAAIDPGLQFIPNLDQRQRADLVAFMHALTDPASAAEANGGGGGGNNGPPRPPRR